MRSKCTRLETRCCDGSRTSPVMKTIPLLLITLAFSSPALRADDYTVFHVCQDQHIIHTADGADAGHVEYIVCEPGSHRIVSTVVTGGVVGERFVPVPFEVMQFNNDREIMLTQITRERIESAPVIERTQIASTTVVQPALFERTSQHFGVRFDAQTNIREGERREFGRTETNRTNVPASGGANGGGTLDRRDNDPAHRDHENRNGVPPSGRPGADENRDHRHDPSHPDVNRNDADRNGKAGHDRKPNASDPQSGRSATDKNGDNPQSNRQNQPAGSTDKTAEERANAEKQSQQKEGEKAQAHKAENAPPSGRAKPENEDSAAGAATPKSKHADTSAKEKDDEKKESSPPAAAKRSQSESETPKARAEKGEEGSSHAEKAGNQEHAKGHSAEKSEAASEAKAAHKPAKPSDEEQPKHKKQEQ